MPSISEWIALFEYLGLTMETIVPFLIFGFFGYLLISSRIGKVEKNLKKTIDKIASAVVEMQTILNNSGFNLKQNLKLYGEAQSPLRLKRNLKHLITDSGLDKQVEEKLHRLTKWLKNKNPETGLDAQNHINSLVIKGEISKFLNLTDYNQLIYKNGKASGDALAILVLYLYEVLIPEVITEDS